MEPRGLQMQLLSRPWASKPVKPGAVLPLRNLSGLSTSPTRPSCHIHVTHYIHNITSVHMTQTACHLQVLTLVYRHTAKRSCSNNLTKHIPIYTRPDSQHAHSHTDGPTFLHTQARGTCTPPALLSGMDRRESSSWRSRALALRPGPPLGILALADAPSFPAGPVY